MATDGLKLRATEAEKVLRLVFGRGLAKAHAARDLDRPPEPTYRVLSEYDPFAELEN